jgi:hypothetical protein
MSHFCARQKKRYLFSGSFGYLNLFSVGVILPVSIFD